MRDKWIRRRILVILIVLLVVIIICLLFCKMPLREAEMPIIAPSGELVWAVPKGSWYIYGPLSGSRIVVTANVSMDVMVGVASAVFMASEFPNGTVTWSGTEWGTISLVRDGEYYAIVLNDICFAGRVLPFLGYKVVVPEAVGVGWVSQYNKLCKKAAQYPVLWRGDIRVDYGLYKGVVIETMYFGLHGGGSAKGVPENPARTEFVRHYYQNIRSVMLVFDVYEKRVTVNNTLYIIYMRPAVWMAVRPSADALVTVKVSTRGE
jgi:hypothetical protein